MDTLKCHCGFHSITHILLLLAYSALSVNLWDDNKKKIGDNCDTLINMHIMITVLAPGIVLAKTVLVLY